MGGWGYQIFGSIDPKLTEPTLIPKSFMDKILGRQRIQKPKEMDIGNAKLIELPADRFSSIKEHYRDYLTTMIQSPWPATTYIFQYLDLDVMTIQFRGETVTASDTTNWYIQVSFSGCAGEGDIAAQLASHWFFIYHKNNFQKLRDRFFTPNGFFPSENASDDSELTFLPLTEGGYSVFNSDAQEMFFTDKAKLFHFQVDPVAIGSAPDGGLNMMTALEEKYAALMTDGKCRCQLCMPAYNLK